MRHVLALLCAVACVPAAAQCTWDADARVLSDGVITLQFPAVGEPSAIAIRDGERVVSPRHWYYCVMGDQQAGRPNFRSLGALQSLTVLEAGPDRAGVRVECLTDSPDDPEMGRWVMTYSVEAGRGAVVHEMTYTPREPQSIRSYDFYVATEQASADTHLLHVFERGTEVGAMPVRTSEAYGRITLPQHLVWAALEALDPGRALAVGAPTADVRDFRYCIEFKRFELSRAGGRITEAKPLHDFALLAVGDDAQALAALHGGFIAAADRPPRAAEPDLPAPDLARPAPASDFGIGVAGNTVGAGDLKLTIDQTTGAVAQLTSAAGDALADPGGIVFVEWPDRTVIGPAGAVTNLRASDDALAWDWSASELEVAHELRPSDGLLQWTAQVTNRSDRQRLLEVRLSLPVDLGQGEWYCWDGMELSRTGPDAGATELTTLMPGGIASQGIFPAVCLSNERRGVAMGLQPMVIESFYGSRLNPAATGADRWHYAIRWALEPGASRTARFVIYAIDPQWSWRSVVERYWAAFPEVFAAPERDDIWGLYSACSLTTLHNQGDIFIERCRRFRVGGMELYAPFSQTGDFFPDADPAYQRGELGLTREQVIPLYETANIACCNLSYVIPTKCERELAKSSYADSVIRLVDGSMFLLDTWDVMGGKTEKLAGMNALRNSYQEHLHGEVMQIVETYRPDGFYFDNGAFVWQDYESDTEWTAFDDEGNVYTNAGIAYAILQDMLAERAPHIHRNPGEFIQYFSGFRGHSHLTNCTTTQRHYVRTHRLIMGHKPIFPGHPRNSGSRSVVYDHLEAGGLLWLVGFRNTGERFAQAWAPISIALARAGWQPVPRATADNPRIRVERFGAVPAVNRRSGILPDNAVEHAVQAPTLFTVRNLSQQPIATTITLAGEYPTLADFHGRLDLSPEVADGLTRAALTVDAGEMVFLTTDPPTPRTKPWPDAPFLAQAAPLSIAIPAEPSNAEYRMARRVRGFVEQQAELLGHSAIAAIVRGDAGEQILSLLPAGRVIIRGGAERATLQAEGNTLSLAFGKEEEGRRLLSDYLDTIAIPLSDEPAPFAP